jgi:anti-anti-sigma factor
MQQKNAFEDIQEDKNALTCPLMVIVRPSQSIYFGNVERVLDTIRSIVKKHATAKVLIFDGESVSFIDASAVELFAQFIAEKEAKGIAVVFANTQNTVYQKLHHSGLVDLIGSENFVTGKGMAIKRATKMLAALHRGPCGTNAFIECAEHR